MGKTLKQTETDKIKTTTERHLLKCQLTQDQLLARGNKLAHILDDLTKLADEKKAVSEQHKAQEAKLQAEITVLQQEIRNCYVMEYIECRLHLNYTTQEALLIREELNILRRSLSADGNLDT